MYHLTGGLIKSRLTDRQGLAHQYYIGTAHNREYRGGDIFMGRDIFQKKVIVIQLFFNLHTRTGIIWSCLVQWRRVIDLAVHVDRQILASYTRISLRSI